MSTEHVFICLCDHARDVLYGMGMAYKLPPPMLLRVIIESVLDAASEDGAMQAELAAAARYLRRTGHVPDCWLDLEGARYEDGPDDSGPETYSGNEKTADAAMRQSWAEYGDGAAACGEQDDNHAMCDLARKRRWREGPGFPSLADAG